MPSNPFHRRSPRTGWHRIRRNAYSLVEVVAAIGLMAATLVPALSLVRDGMEQSEQTDRRQLLALYAASQIEQKLAEVAMDWTTGADSGDYDSLAHPDGHPDIRFVTVSSDEVADGGIPDTLMDVRTTVYYDENQDNALTTGELQCSYRTKIGKFATYAAEAL